MDMERYLAVLLARKFDTVAKCKRLTDLDLRKAGVEPAAHRELLVSAFYDPDDGPDIGPGDRVINCSETEHLRRGMVGLVGKEVEPGRYAVGFGEFYEHVEDVDRRYLDRSALDNADLAMDGGPASAASKLRNLITRVLCAWTVQ